jgi:Tfp pilus assembly protein PilO
MLGLIPIVLAVAFYFLLLAPKREEARQAGEKLAEQQQRRDQSVSKLEQASRTQANFASDYAEMVSLGKAIPTSVDTPSLLVQLDRAARGTEIEFRSVKAGEQAGSSSGASGGGAGASASSGGASGSPGGGSGSSPGGASGSGDQGSGGSPESGGSSGTEAGSGSSAPNAQGSGGSSAPGLESVPLEFKFAGTYFDLASFFHRMKRFVYVEGDEIEVRGRLMTLDSLKLSDEGEPGADLVAEIKATVYLSPRSEGATVGATPQGPATAGGAPASSTATPPAAGTAP